MTHLSLCSGIGGLDLAIGTPAAFAEVDQAPASVLAHHWPDVPNLGDWTVLDNFDPWPDLITGGLPCQPVSGAGKGRGDTDERYLFDDLVRILRSSDVRPTLVLENVRGILYPRNGVAFWRFISALADLGYVGRWEVVRASDVGAPHRRERWFCVARHPDGASENFHPAPGGPRNPVGESDRRVTPHPDDIRRDWYRADSANQAGRPVERGSANSDRCDVLRQSRYGPAVARWETLTRPAPAPVNDRGRLAVPFVEWMMGYPAGWTDRLTRIQALKALGNAVVPQQARLALDILAGPAVAAPQQGELKLIQTRGGTV